MIESKADLKEYIRRDLLNRSIPRWKAGLRLTDRIAYFQWLLRRSEYWHNCRRDPIGRAMAAVLRLRTKLLGERMGFSIPRNTCGPGLSIAHIGTIVINMNARIGAECRIHQGVTVGEANGRYPVVGDRAQIGPNACIIGAILGDDVRVYPGAVVTRDFESRSDVAGVPARLVRRRD